MKDIAVITILASIVATAMVLCTRHMIKKKQNNTDKRFVEEVKKIRKKYGLGSS